MALASLERMREDEPSHLEVLVAAVAFCFDGTHLCLLLVERGAGFELPAVPLKRGKTPTECARAALHEHGLRDSIEMQQVGAFSSDGRGDLDIVLFGVCPPSAPSSGECEDHLERSVEERDSMSASTPRWVPLSSVEDLAPDVRTRVQSALLTLRREARFDRVAFRFLSHEFSLSELQRVFEAILGKSIDVRNFRKKIDALDILVESENKPRGMAYRPPRLFRFDADKFAARLESEGEIRFF